MKVLTFNNSSFKCSQWKMSQLTFFAILLLAWPVFSADSETCNSLGLRCSRDCKRVEYCADTDEEPALIRTCSESSFCEFKKGIPQCGGRSCPGAKPDCATSGSLPSPFDCHDYTVCSGDNQGTMDAIVNSCSNGEVFDVVEQTCKKDVKCRRSIRCRRAGDNGFVDPDTRRFCYYCKERNSPFVYPCDPESNPKKF